MGGRTWLDADVPDRSRLLPMPFGRVFACDVGPGPDAEDLPPVCLLHGLFVTHHSFSAIIPALARRRRVIALDLPGCGDSDRPAPAVTDGYSFAWLASAALQTLGAIGVGRFDLVGHDFGGTLALALAAEQPARVRRLAVLNPLALTVSLPLTGPLGVTSSLGLEVFRRTFRKAYLRRFLEQGMSTPELLDESDLCVYWDRLGRRGGRTAAWAMLTELSAVVRLRDSFAAVRPPCLVIWGDRDRLVPPEHAGRLCELLPDARLALIEGCGHNPAAERPDRVIALLERHFSGADELG